MTITVNSVCSHITLTSNILLINNLQNTLEVTYQGAVTVVPLALGVSIKNIVPADLGMTTAFSDGVYSIKLLSRLTSGSVQEDLGCAVVLCATSCTSKMYSWYEDVDLPRVLAYEALLIGKQCNSCSCSTLENLFTKLTEDVTNPCGTCSCSM